MASASGYNYHRFARAVLKKARKWEPSLSIQLYPTYWRFENSEINFLYDGPMKPFLLALRAQVIPAALIPFLYDIRPPVSFVDGCLVVELQDHRTVPEIRSRIVMRPAPETLPLTIDIMLERRHETWDEKMTLELESRIMAATSAPLYLGTSPLAVRNAALSLALTAPAGRNTGADGAVRTTQAPGEEEDSEQETIRKLLSTGSQRAAFQPNWSVLRLMERIKAHTKQKEADAAARAAGQSGGSGGGGAGGSGSNAKSGEGSEKKKVKKKRPAEAEPEEPKKPAKKKKTANAAKDKDKENEKDKDAKETPKGKSKAKDKDKDKDADKEKEKDKDKDGDKDKSATKAKSKPKPKKDDAKGKDDAKKDDAKGKGDAKAKEDDKAEEKKKTVTKKKKKPAATEKKDDK